jgi:hypothetical protein
MSTPGMFADASLYRTSGRYRIAGTSNETNGVKPAQFPSLPSSYHPSASCFWDCLATCRPSPLNPYACVQMCMRRCFLW